ncbi:hypothetical protein BKA70DRAFT_1237497 [Coprinopsis sp. MPI-PUGE-AT-0042]|nr:hypothetical protein BKA70DRAFT_1237497 [Coprinopsis sp. MPI-PUGE-AT-0042]
MDVLNIKIEKPPSQAKVQNILMEEEQNTNTNLGVTSWISAGMKIQENQIHVRGHVKGLKKRKTEKQVLEVSRKREQLQSEINTFYETGAVLYPDIDFQEIHCDLPPNEAVEIDGESPSDVEDGTNSFSLSLNEAEDVDLALPSSFPFALPASMTVAKSTELKLRIAQADESLESIRSDIGHKSFLFRSNIRLVQGKKGRSRGYAAVAAVDRSLRSHIKIYHQAVWALRRLGAPRTIQSRYRQIAREDTKAITAVYSPNAAGERNKPLSWIWTTRGEENCSTSPYLEELYRVNWLRARSRADRWKEEVTLLKCEMEWVLNFFSYKADEAKAWATMRRKDPGHRAYACKKAEMWRLLGVHAEKRCGFLFNHHRSQPVPSMATVLSLPQDSHRYSLRDWQSLVHYGSSRLSHCAKEIVLVYYDTPDLRAICATQLERDVQSVMTIWSTASLLFPGQLSIPVTLQNLAKVIVDRQIREKKVLLAAIRRDPSFFDAPVSSFIDAWWSNSPIVPWTMTLDELATAWRAQRDAFD